MNPASAAVGKRQPLPVITSEASAEAPDLPDFEGFPAEEILEWSFRNFGLDAVIASSMQDSVLIDLAHRVEPRVEVFFLDTGFHFYETIATAKAVRARYNLNLVMLDPVDDPAVWSEEGYRACCNSRKVEPMNRYLKDKKAWMSGLRRAESESRRTARAVEWDSSRGLVKVNPIVEWSDEQVDAYIKKHDLIVNPLRKEGYDSIGCVPCTIPGNGREGRWVGSDQSECGIHQVHPAISEAPQISTD